MTLTLAHGPLAKRAPETVNYRVDGPGHRLLFDDFPRRIRGLVGDEVVVDSVRAKLLHETGYLPQLYVPEEDVRTDLLEPTDHRTRCPFKGDASYWSIRVGDRTVENGVWGYPAPIAGAEWLRGYRGFYWKAMDTWLDEDEVVEGHLRDPYHRVDVRPSRRHVRVLAGDDVVAETDRSMLLSETGLPNRFYVPLADVRRDLLEASETHTHCPYKGTASYWSVRRGDTVLSDVAWFYPEPFDGVARIRDHVCFLGDGIVTEVDETRSAGAWREDERAAGKATAGA